MIRYDKKINHYHRHSAATNRAYVNLDSGSLHSIQSSVGQRQGDFQASTTFRWTRIVGEHQSIDIAMLSVVIFAVCIGLTLANGRGQYQGRYVLVGRYNRPGH